MNLGFIVLVLFLCLTESNGSSCGPGKQCICNGYNNMNCSNTQLEIRVICDYIDNVTSYNISALSLKGNGYTRVDDYELKGCQGLIELFLGENNISDVWKNSFEKFNHLEMLDLSHNSLHVYNETDQQMISFPLSIKVLLLNGNLNVNTNDVMGYPDLSYLPHLTVLCMDGLLNKTFPATYLNITTLETVSLSGLSGNCFISHISNLTFQNIPYVTVLNLSSCDVENVYAGAFNSLSHLETLDLSYNLRLGFRILRNISYSLQFTQIKLLNMSKVHSTFGIGTQVRRQDLCYLWNTSLIEMVLNHNRIQLVETNALVLIPETLKVLRIEDNKFTFGPYLLQLGCLSNLEELYGNYQNTAHNPKLYEKEPNENVIDRSNGNNDCPFLQNYILRNISIHKGNCPYFANNKIQPFIPTFPNQLKRLLFAQCNLQYSLKLPLQPIQKHIEYLDFSGNILYSWIGPVGLFPNLKCLNLSRNYCSHIGPTFFDEVKNVENLQIQENFLGSVLSNENEGPLIFETLGKVKVLNLSSNFISFLPPMIFSKMYGLETLDLSVNNIEKWTMNINSLDSLLYLNLKFNFFQTLPSDLRNKLGSNSMKLGKPFKIDLRNNSFAANCAEKAFLSWMVNHNNNMLYFKDYIFRDKTGALISPEQFVMDVDNLEKECRSYTLFYVFPSIGISVFLSIVVGGIIYRNRWKLRYLMRISKIRKFGYMKLLNDPNVTENFKYDAFISYANADLRFILDKIIPTLDEQELKLCVHDRDFLPGNNIADNILDAIRNSRKTVVILTKEFLKSKWCLYEFNMARMESIYSRDGANCLLVVMLENVPSRNMTTEMLDWIKSNTYIEYTAEEDGELLFWDNLKDALRSE